jgi:DNA primase
MAEAGSFADKVKTQADIVRVVGEYVRLKKSGQNFMGLCPFHSEKSPSFAVHPVKQIYHCFGCGVGGDVFSFVMAMEKCDFREAITTVAEKCGIAIPKARPSSPQEKQATHQRTALIELHRAAAQFFLTQLNGTPEGKAARAYLEDRGLERETIEMFRVGYAPSAGDALTRALRGKFSEKLLADSGLVARDPSGRLYDRFRRRILFPIADERGRVVAFGGRALGDDLPKYLNSPETPIYSKSRVLYNLERAKEAIRKSEFAVLVEGYMDAIGVHRAGVGNVVATCGTALTEQQLKLLGRFARRVVVNFDPDAAGQIATERSLGLLVEQGFEVRVLVLPRAKGEEKAPDPDLFVRTRGGEAYRKALGEAPPYVDYLIARARQMDLSSAEGKLRALNFLMPYVQRAPDRLLRSEWATRIAQQLRIEEPVLRESLRKAAAERRSEVRPKPELLGAAVKPAERRILQMLFEAEGFREKLAREIRRGELHKGLETERLLATVLEFIERDEKADPTSVGNSLPEEKDKRLLFDILFEPMAEATWDEAESCLAVLKRRHIEAELASVQKEIEANAAGADLRKLLARKQDLRKLLAELGP